MYTAAQQATDLETFIENDSYLRGHRGQYAERNGASLPWQHQVDVRVLQDIFTNIGENRNALQFSIDIFNVGNLINRNWGLVAVSVHQPAAGLRGLRRDGYAHLPVSVRGQPHGGSQRGESPDGAQKPLPHRRNEPGLALAGSDWPTLPV